MSKRFKKSKKDDQIVIDEKTGQLYIGDKDLRLIMLRPIEIIEFCEFAGTNAEDIILWVGKSIAKYFMEKLFPAVDFTKESMTTKKEIILNVLETFEHLGYGVLSPLFRKKEILIRIIDPVISREKENIMAKNVCVLYLGIFNGMLDQLELDAEGDEIKCLLMGDEMCVYKFDLLTTEFGDEDVDAEEEGAHISSFLKSL